MRLSCLVADLTVLLKNSLKMQEQAVVGFFLPKWNAKLHWSICQLRRWQRSGVKLAQQSCSETASHCHVCLKEGSFKAYHHGEPLADNMRYFSVTDDAGLQSEPLSDCADSNTTNISKP